MPNGNMSRESELLLPVSVCRHASCVCALCIMRQLLACEHSRGHSFSPIIIKLAQNDHLDNMSVKLNMGDIGSKTRSVGQIIEKPCERSRGHSFGPIFIKLAQNDHLDNISVKVEYGWRWVKN